MGGPIMEQTVRHIQQTTWIQDWGSTVAALIGLVTAVFGIILWYFRRTR